MSARGHSWRRAYDEGWGSTSKLLQDSCIHKHLPLSTLESEDRACKERVSILSNSQVEFPSVMENHLNKCSDHKPYEPVYEIEEHKLNSKMSQNDK